MIRLHDYSACRLNLCERCHDFATGWASGKEKQLTEIASTIAEQHPKGCHCSPCAALQSEVEALSRLSGGKYASLARLLPRRRAVAAADGEAQ